MTQLKALGALVALFLPGLAHAGTLSGDITFTDRQYGLTGGSPVFQADAVQPVRYALVKAYADLPDIFGRRGLEIGAGVTDGTGHYEITIGDTGTVDVEVVVVAFTNAFWNADLAIPFHPSIQVRNPASGRLARAGTGLSPTDTTADTVVDLAIPRADSEAFNIYETVLLAYEYMDAIEPGIDLDSPTFRVDYPEGTSCLYRRQRDAIVMGVGRGFEDDVILHEVGHWAMSHFGDLPGGSCRNHGFNTFCDPRVAWKEGWASWFSSAVRAHHGYNHPELYLSRNGGAFWGASAETRASVLSGNIYGHAVTQANELAVLASLVDVSDATGGAWNGAAEAFDGVDGREQTLWQAFRAMPPHGDQDQTFEGWFRQWEILDAGNVQAATGTWHPMAAVDIDGPLDEAQIRFYPDGSAALSLEEPNDRWEEAWFVSTADFPEQYTMFTPPAPHLDDEDWYYVFHPDPIPDGVDARVEVDASRIHGLGFVQFMDDAGDVEVRAHLFEEYSVGPVTEGCEVAAEDWGPIVEDDDDPPVSCEGPSFPVTDHEDRVDFLVPDPDPTDGLDWFLEFHVQVRLSGRQDDIEYGYHELDVTVTPTP